MSCPICGSPPRVRHATWCPSGWLLVLAVLVLAGCMSPPGMTLQQRERQCVERGDRWVNGTCTR